MALTLGTMQCEITVLAAGPSGESTATETYRDLSPDPTRTIAVPPLGGPVSRLSISIRDLNAGEPGHVHLRDLRLR
jgi:hypothetical protein